MRHDDYDVHSQSLEDANAVLCNVQVDTIVSRKNGRTRIKSSQMVVLLHFYSASGFILLARHFLHDFHVYELNVFHEYLIPYLFAR